MKRSVTVIVDRPLGSTHPAHPGLVYPVNYGYVPGVIAADGEEQDAYILGIGEPVRQFTGVLAAVVYRRDDVEEKWVVVPVDADFTEAEVARLIDFQEQYFNRTVHLCGDWLHRNLHRFHRVLNRRRRQWFKTGRNQHVGRSSKSLF